ncbi:MAG: histidine kinase [Spirosomaceae bacterium]|jgi:ligand-binding sensor domain-containing protein|nr:histidine kinase [Spirosomataceae bacterium]
MKKVLLFLFFSCYFVFSKAQTPHLRRYTVDDGLPSSHIYRTFQDSEGYIWVCTDKGLARFDGYRFEKFTTKEGLPYNDIWGIAEDSQKRLWFTSYAHTILYYDLKEHKFHSIKVKDLDPKAQFDHVMFFQKKGDKILAFKSYESVIEIENGKTALNYLSAEYSLATFFDIYKDLYLYVKKNKTKVFEEGYPQQQRTFAENLQFILDGKVDKVRNYSKDFFEGESILCSLHFPDRNLFCKVSSIWTANGKNIFKKDLKELSMFPNNRIIYFSKIGNTDLCLITTEKEQFVIDKNLNRQKEYDFIDELGVNSLFIDKEFNVWISSKQDGLLMLTQEAIKSKVFNILENVAVKAICRDARNRIWIGTDLGQLFIYENQKLRLMEFEDQMKVSISKIVADASGGVLIAWINNSLMHLKDAEVYKKIKFQEVIFYNFTNFKFSDDRHLLFKNVSVKDILQTNDKNIQYIITGKNVHYLQQNKNNVYIEFAFRNLGYRSFAIEELTNGEIYFGTGIGLIKKNNNDLDLLSTLKSKYPIANQPITDLLTDNQDNLWVATDGFGIYRVRDNKVDVISELNGMIIKNFYFDKSVNRIWMATNDGVHVISVQSESPLKYTYNKISVLQGLPTQEIHSVYADGNKLFAGTNNGLVIINLDNFFANRVDSVEASPLVVKNVKVNRRDTTLHNDYRLKYNQNNIELEFVGLSYKSDRNIKYEYRMTGIDNEWHTTSDLKREFTTLPPGSYEFELRATDIENKPLKNFVPIKFEILPPFWQTWWFYLSIVGLVLAIVYSGFKVFKRNQNKAIEINKKFADLELQALQSQMNPHFVFNALSSIQSFILNKDFLTANDYLTNFSKLIRAFLESSRDKYISIQEEVLLIERYIKLEKVRFRDKFEFEIIQSENVNPSIEIPSMLIQPFVENAINHGLLYKENKGNLIVSFDQQENQLLCVIDDDGVGRAKAAELKNKSLKSYKSRAMEITEERMRTLQILDNIDVSINVIDKVDESNNATGTRIEIKIYIN